MDTLLRGIAIGFAIAAPVGPIGLLCINRTLRFGFGIGFTSGAGAAVADACYALLAACAFSAVTSLFAQAGHLLHVLGSIVLFGIGIRTMFARRSVPGTERAGSTSFASAFASTFSLTMVNPLTIVSFAAIVPGSTRTFAPGSAIGLVSGVFCGSLIWWAVLSSTVALVRRTIEQRLRRALDVLSGGALALIGVISLLR